MERENETEKRGTIASSFGVSKRESHDSSKFYNSKLYQDIPRPNSKIKYVDNSYLIPINVLDNIILEDSRDMSKIPDSSIHLMITSPPYNVSKEYDEDLSLKEYISLLEDVFTEVWRVLVPGGRAAINIANVGRKPYIPLHAYVIDIMHKIGFHMRGEIIWNKAASAGISTAWGSFASASNPTFRDVHEYILVFSKLTNKLEKKENENSIKKEDFIEWTKSIWTFPAESAKKIGHPAPFPEELPKRLIEFFTFKGHIVLDPFMGSGTTALAAIKLKRHFVGYEISKEYIGIAKKRIKEITSQKQLDFFM